MTPTLPLCRYRLQFSATNERVSDFPGSHWRGALGYALRESACVTGAGSCESCTVKSRCAYAYLFETSPGCEAEKMRRYQQVPHPYSLREEVTPERGGPRLMLTLFGRGNDHLSLMVLALARAAASPRGIGGRRMALLSVEQETVPGLDKWQGKPSRRQPQASVGSPNSLPSAPGNSPLPRNPQSLTRKTGR